MRLRMKTFWEENKTMICGAIGFVVGGLMVRWVVDQRLIPEGHDAIHWDTSNPIPNAEYSKEEEQKLIDSLSEHDAWALIKKHGEDNVNLVTF